MVFEAFSSDHTYSRLSPAINMTAVCNICAISAWVYALWGQRPVVYENAQTDRRQGRHLATDVPSRQLSFSAAGSIKEYCRARNHPADRSHTDADRSDPSLAAQSQLGLRPERWPGTGTHHRHRAALDGAAVIIGRRAEQLLFRSDFRIQCIQSRSMLGRPTMQASIGLVGAAIALDLIG